MGSIEGEIAAGILALIVGLFGWMFKNTATRANNANALSRELSKRMDKVEEELKVIRKIEVDQGIITNDISHMKNDMAKIARYMEQGAKKNV